MKILLKLLQIKKLTDKNFPIAIDFKRKLNNLNLNIYHHLGIYAYKPEYFKKIN